MYKLHTPNPYQSYGRSGGGSDKPWSAAASAQLPPLQVYAVSTSLISK